ATGINYGCPPKGWRFDQETMRKKIEEGRILFPPGGKGRPRHKLFLFEMKSVYKNQSSIITHTHTGEGTREVDSIIGPSSVPFPKPSALVRLLIDQAISEAETILD